MIVNFSWKNMFYFQFAQFEYIGKHANDSIFDS